MKRIILGMTAAVAMIAASCEKAPMDPVLDGKVATLSIDVGLPEMSTRAYADGTTATHLRYAVYEITGNDIQKVKVGTETENADPYEGEKDLNNLATKLSFNLLTGHTYGIAFWADAYGKNGTEVPYTVEFGESGATMTVDYDNVKANDEKLDAFYAYKEVKVNGDGTVSVQLFRPFAQINIGTNDFEKAKALGGAPDQSYVTVPTYKTLDLMTGAASNPTEEAVTFAYNSIPGQAGVASEKYPVEGYDYLAMAYVLVDEGGETIEMKFAWAASPASAGKERTVGSVPVKRNYRTNIYGSILTSSLDLNVEIVPGVGGEDNVMLEWDGETFTQPAFDKETATYTVNGADELAWLASQTEADFEEQTIILQNDLDLKGLEFPAFASGAKRNGSEAKGTSFNGVFDGNGKTISGLKVTSSSDEDDTILGFIASVAGKDAKVKNVIFEGVEISGAEQAGVIGLVSEGATVEGVVVKSGSIKSKKATGGIVGRVLKSGTVKSCENHASVESTANNAGGIIGAAYYTQDAETTMTITDCHNYGEVKSAGAGTGGIVGLNCGDISGCTNHGTVTGSTTSTGGIVGEQKAAGSVKGCTNYADVKGGTGYGSGGIVGWVRYSTEAAYPYNAPIEVSGCVNEAKHITGTQGVGGIVGMWYSDGTCTENTNFAESITASGSFVAGIVGGTQWTEVDSGRTMEYGDKKLVVTYNTTYTPDENITGASKDMIIYDNTGGKHTVIDDSNKTPTMTTASNQEALAAAASAKEEGAYIKVSAGEYTLPQGGFANNVTIDGSGDATFTIESSSLNLPAGLSGQNITFKNAKFNYKENSSYAGYQNAGLTYINCEFEGQVFSYSSNCKYIGCKFSNSGDNYCMWTYVATPITFEECEFYSEGKALLLYREQSTVTHDVTIKNCKFYASTAVEGKAAIEISSQYAPFKVVIENCTAEGFGLGNMSNNTLWNVKNSNNPVTVTVDDNVVFKND